MLVAIHDQRVGLDVDRPRRGGVEAEERRVARSHQRPELVGDLELAEHGAVHRPAGEAVFAPGATLVDLAFRVDRDQRHARRIGALLQLENRPRPPAVQRSLLRGRIQADADHPHLGAILAAATA